MMRMIVAMDNRRGMANDDGIPWDLPTDRRFFSDQTAEGIILMGYGTYAEVDEPLHGRTNFVATRRTMELRAGFSPVADVDTFLAEHRGEPVQNIGGAGLFASLLPQADELVLTRVDGDFHCTKFFPRFDDAFERVSRSEPVTENGTSFTFETWHPIRGR